MWCTLLQFIDKTLGPRFLGPDVVLLDNTVAFGITNVKSNCKLSLCCAVMLAANAVWFCSLSLVQ